MDTDKMEQYLLRQQKIMKAILFTLVILVIVISFCAITIIPRLCNTIAKADAALNQTYETMVDAQDAVSDISVSVKKLDSFLENSESGITAITEKLDDFDIKTLNAAIKELEAVVKPMAKLMGYYK